MKIVTPARSAPPVPSRRLRRSRIVAVAGRSARTTTSSSSALVTVNLTVSCAAAPPVGSGPLSGSCAGAAGCGDASSCDASCAWLPKETLGAEGVAPTLGGAWGDSAAPVSTRSGSRAAGATAIGCGNGSRSAGLVCSFARPSADTLCLCAGAAASRDGSRGASTWGSAARCASGCAPWRRAHRLASSCGSGGVKRWKTTGFSSPPYSRSSCVSGLLPQPLM
mmetsp:Transcript_20759/g.58726  ORF Transcript_20759/g.58726 Transcript_20759/m.58726 type:complete len:222 (-) Transcript_20759:310-975(-)